MEFYDEGPGIEHRRVRVIEDGRECLEAGLDPVDGDAVLVRLPLRRTVLIVALVVLASCGSDPLPPVPETLPPTTQPATTTTTNAPTDDAFDAWITAVATARSDIVWDAVSSVAAALDRANPGDYSSLLDVCFALMDVMAAASYEFDQAYFNDDEPALRAATNVSNATMELARATGCPGRDE